MSHVLKWPRTGTLYLKEFALELYTKLLYIYFINVYFSWGKSL